MIMMNPKRTQMESNRPFWQEERGERHGNNRKWIAKQKWIERKRNRKRNNLIESKFEEL